MDEQKRLELVEGRKMIAHLLRKREELEKQIEGMKKRIDEQRDMFRKELNHGRAEEHRLREISEMRLEMFYNAEAKRNELQRKYDELAQEFRDNDENYRRIVYHMNEGVNKLTREKNGLKMEIGVLKDTVKTLEKDTNEWACEYNQVDKSLVKLDEDYRKLKAENKQLRVDYGCADLEVERHSRENKRLKAENEKLKNCLKLFDNTGRLVKELLEK